MAKRIAALAAAPAVPAEAPVVDDPELADDPAVDDPEAELVDDIIEIPVHGVATVTGTPTGDGRMFANGGLTNRPLPLPLRMEVVGTHGGDTSEVLVVGVLDEIWMEGNQQRYRGRIMMDSAAGPDTVAGIIDGRYKGVSVEVDDISVDVSEDRAQLMGMLMGKEAEGDDAGELLDKFFWDGETLTEEEAAIVADAMIGDGTQPVTVYSGARTCGFTVVPIPAFHEGFIALGSEFPDELSADSKAALVASGCNCAEPTAEDIAATNAEFTEIVAEMIAEAETVELGQLDDEELAAYDAMDEDAQRAFLIGRRQAGLIASATETEEFAPGTHDGPGWITNPRATARIRTYWTHGEGAAKIRWGEPGDFNRCRKQLSKYVQNPDWLAGLCANMHKEALGIWPGQEAANSGEVMVGGITASAVKLVKYAGRILPADAFRNPELTELTPLTVTKDGRVYGHLAAWGSCHIGVDGMCSTPPFSANDYSYFRVGVVDTEEGEVRVGHLTAGIGHAGQYQDIQQATAHYDRDDATIADVAVYEDSFGIAYAGMIRPGTSPDRVADFKANGVLSGDWRYINQRDLELVAAVAVNTGGFPIPRMAVVASGGRQTALIAAGMVMRPQEVEMKLTPATVADIANAAVDQYIHRQGRDARLSAAKVKAGNIRSLQLKRAKDKLETIGKGH